MDIRHNWTLPELKSLYETPFLDLIFQAATLHRMYHRSTYVQLCHLISIKTGGCTEDCKYCAQSSRYNTFVDPVALLSEEEVLSKAQQAMARGVTRICLGAAWRNPNSKASFEKMLMLVRKVADLGAEVCCTFGMLTEEQVQQLKEAGTYAYNHNLDTSREYYSKVVTTRSYDDRLQTLDRVQAGGLSVCCGGIIGMGESIEDRLNLLLTLANRNPHPDSVPINVLYRVPGTPFQDEKPVAGWDWVRLVAIARICMPQAFVRLSAGRVYYSQETQALCFMAGANSIHIGEKLLTIPNQGFDADEELFKILGFT